MSELAYRPGVFGTDYRPREVLAACILAASIPVWTFILLKISRLHRHADEVTQIEKGDTEQAVSVTPMIDFESPLLKGGGKKVKLPEAWSAPAPAPRKRTAVASTNAKDDPDAIPDKGLEVYDGGAPPNPSAATTTDPSADPNPPAGEGGGPPTEEPGGDGDGGSDGSKNGNTNDRAKARAARIYRGQLSRFFRAGFRCPQLPEGAQKCSPTGSVSISGDLTVSSVSFNGCGVPEIDSAARAALQAKQGQQVPPPPEDYPELQLPAFGVTYTCK